MKNIFPLVALLLFLLGCSDDRKMINLALKDGEKVYLVPFIAEKSVIENDLNQNKTPAVSKSTQIIEERGELFIEPKHVKRVLNLIADNYELYQEKGDPHDGYVIFKDKAIYEHMTDNINTERIGQQIKQNTIRIFSKTQSKPLEIVWSSFPEPMAKKNCVVKRLWVVEHPYPGKTVESYQDAVVINLNDLVNFYDNGTTLKYDEGDEILYVIK